MKKTVRQLREDRGQSQMQLAETLGATLQEVQDLETGIASPSVERLRRLTEHFGVDETAIDLEPHRPPSLGERVVEALEP
jgi:putative transcriptional regulator